MLPLASRHRVPVRTDRQTSWALEMTPLCTRMCPYLFFEATPPGAAPGPPVKTAARVRRFRGCNNRHPKYKKRYSAHRTVRRATRSEVRAELRTSNEPRTRLRIDTVTTPAPCAAYGARPSALNRRTPRPQLLPLAYWPLCPLVPDKPSVFFSHLDFCSATRSPRRAPFAPGALI